MNDGTRKPSMLVGFLSGFMALVAGNGTALAQDATRLRPRTIGLQVDLKL